MTETTSNHGWTIPEVGGSEDVWGQILNDFFDEELDTEISLKGPFSERPVADSNSPKLYLATDRRIVYYNDGNSWEAVYGLGTDSNPVPGASYFEFLNVEDASVTNAPTDDTDVARKSEVDDKADDPHGNAVHTETFAVDGDEQPPETHGNAAHTTNYTDTSPSDVDSSNWDDYEIQKNGSDGNGIINFKT